MGESDADAVAGAGHEGPGSGAVGVAGEGGGAQVQVEEGEEGVEDVGCKGDADAEKGPESCFGSHGIGSSVRSMGVYVNGKDVNASRGARAVGAIESEITITMVCYIGRLKNKSYRRPRRLFQQLLPSATLLKIDADHSGKLCK